MERALYQPSSLSHFSPSNYNQHPPSHHHHHCQCHQSYHRYRHYQNCQFFHVSLSMRRKNLYFAQKKIFRILAFQLFSENSKKLLNTKLSERALSNYSVASSSTLICAVLHFECKFSAAYVDGSFLKLHYSAVHCNGHITMNSWTV